MRLAMPQGKAQDRLTARPALTHDSALCHCAVRNGCARLSIMSKSRNAWLGLAVLVALVALGGLGWWMMRSRAELGPAAAGGSPAALPAPAPSRPEGTGTAKLSWAPAEPAAASGAASPDPVAGYRVYVGASPEDLRLEASIADPAATGYVVERLPKGTFYYSVTTYTRLGIESERPPPVSKNIE